MRTHIKFIFIVSALFITICPVKSYANSMDMITHGTVKKDVLDFSDKKKWEKIRKNGSYEEQSQLVKEILTLKDAGKVLASLEWLRDAIKKDETYYVYPFMYALQLHRTKYMSNNAQAETTALAMVYYSNLLLMTDAARCDDNGVGTSLMYSLSKELAPVKEATTMLPNNIKTIAMNIALFLEGKNKNRDKQSIICQSGVGYIARALQSKQTETEETIAKKGNYHDHIPGSKVVSIKSGHDVEVFFISDEEWKIQREKIRASFKKSLNKN